MEGKKILVLAYQLSPTRGSEYSVGWNYISEMSKDNQLVVIYGASGNHMGDFENFTSFIGADNFKNVRFIPLSPNVFASVINKINRKNWFIYAFYFAYRIWQWQAYQTALKITRSEPVNLIHYLNPIGFREPGYLWKINIPYIWGPISGTINRPKSLFKELSAKQKVLFYLRNLINTLQFKFNPRLKKAIYRTDLLLTATTDNQNKIKAFYHKSSIYIPENGILESSLKLPLREINLQKNDPVILIWIGRIDSNKSLDILLFALSKINSINYKLYVIGNGPCLLKMRELSILLKIQENIIWVGQIPRIKVFEYLETAHINLITSLSEGNPTTIWEAMSNGIPTISLNHCGMKDVICEKCGIKINITSYDRVTDELADVISDLVNNPQKINLLSRGIKKCITNYTWNRRRELFNSYYQIAIDNWEQRN